MSNERGQSGPDQGEVLCAIDRGPPGGEATERLQVAIREYEGHRFIDLRVWFRTEDGRFLPTKKGVTVRAKELALVVEKLSAAAQRIAPSNGRPAPNRSSGATRASAPRPAPPSTDSELEQDGQLF